jgi:hypothetical protein
MLGVMTVADALRLALQQGLDVGEVNPKAQPPVCKLLDFSKYTSVRDERGQHRGHRLGREGWIHAVAMTPSLIVHGRPEEVAGIEVIGSAGKRLRVVPPPEGVYGTAMARAKPFLAASVSRTRIRARACRPISRRSHLR